MIDFVLAYIAYFFIGFNLYMVDEHLCYAFLGFMALRIYRAVDKFLSYRALMKRLKDEDTGIKVVESEEDLEELFKELDKAKKKDEE